MIDRHYVVAKGKIGVYGDIDVAHLSVSVGGVSASATSEGLHLGGGYGVTDKITAGADYAFAVAGDSSNKGKGPLALFGMFELVHTAKMSITATADLTFDLGGTDAMGGSTTNTTIHAGLGARYLLAPKFAVFTGSPVGPGPVGQHLSVQLNNSGPINFSIPVGFAMQATPELFAYVETELALFRLANKGMADTVSVIGSDITMGGLGIPLTVGGFYAVNKQIDAGLNLSFVDLGHAGDFYTIGIGARWRN